MFVAPDECPDEWPDEWPDEYPDESPDEYPDAFVGFSFFTLLGFFAGLSFSLLSGLFVFKALCFFAGTLSRGKVIHPLTGALPAVAAWYTHGLINGS